MNKQIKIIIILASILVVLVAGNIIIKKVTKFNSEKSQKESEAESLAAAIKVNDYDELSAISFGDFTFTCTDGTWNYDGDSEFPLDSSIIKKIADEFAGLPASRKISNADSIESYGLKKPAYTVKITSQDGGSQTIYIGNSYDGEYYVKDAGNDTVYTCSISCMDDIKADEIVHFAKVDSVNTVWDSTYYSFSLASKDGSSLVLNKDRSVDVYSEDETDENGDKVPNVVWNASVNGGEAYEVTDTTDLSSVRNALDITYDGCLEYKSDDKTLAAYGLDDPTCTIKIGYTDENDKDSVITLTIGTLDSDNKTYSIKSDKSDAIYYITSNKADAIKNCFSYDFKSDETETDADTAAE